MTELAHVLDDLRDALERFVIFPTKHEAVAVVLWIVHTYCWELGLATPYLAVTSAEKRSGKTRLFEILDLLVHAPWFAIMPSAAVLFRKIEAHKPTLLLDEIDTVFGKGRNAQTESNEAVRAVLNAGYRAGAKVTRCSGPKQELREFAVTCPKAFAGIGDLPGTIADRAIPVELKRAPSGSIATRFMRADFETDFSITLCEQLDAISWVDLPKRGATITALNDRAQESWDILLRIAEFAGNSWPGLAEAAAIELHSDSEAEAQDSLGIRLLIDLRDIWPTESDGNGAWVPRQQAESIHLLDALNADELLPWRTLRKGQDKELDARTMARMLRKYDVGPAKRRRKDKTFRGYHLHELQDAWSRYAPVLVDPPSSPTPPNVEQRNNVPLEAESEGLCSPLGPSVPDDDGLPF